MASLDVSLDDMIKNRRNSDRGRGVSRPRPGRGAGRSLRGGRTTGAQLKGPLSLHARPSAIAKELFSEIGELIRYGVHYGKNGRPSGSAEVVFARRSDAFQALNRYNNVQLDGKPMKIEIIGVSAEVPLSAHVNVVGRRKGKRRIIVMGPQSGRSFGSSAAFSRNYVQKSRGVGARRHGLSHGGAQWRKKTLDKSAEELDRELENYHAEAMPT